MILVLILLCIIAFCFGAYAAGLCAVAYLFLKAVS